MQYGMGTAKYAGTKRHNRRAQSWNCHALLCSPARLWREAYHKVTERGPCHSNDGRVGDAQEGDRETVGLHREEQLVSLAIEDSSRLELQAEQNPGRLSG